MKKNFLILSAAESRAAQTFCGKCGFERKKFCDFVKVRILNDFRKNSVSNLQKKKLKQ